MEKKSDQKYEIIIIILSVIAIFNFISAFIMWKMYSPQAEIVLHDYGQIFETIEDWKIWRIDHNK